MDYKKLLLPALFLVLVMATANAAITVTVTTPTANKNYQPNMNDADDCMDLNFMVADNNTNQPVHKANIYYDHPDGNVYILTDANLSGNSGGYCKLGAAGSWATATCALRYCWPSDLTSGNYTIDVNVTGYHTGGTVSFANDEGFQNITIDNRYVTTSVEGLVNIIPIVLVGVILIVICLTLLGYIDPKIAAVLLPSLIIALIALMLLGQVSLMLIGK